MILKILIDHLVIHILNYNQNLIKVYEVITIIKVFIFTTIVKLSLLLDCFITVTIIVIIIV